MAYGPSSGFMVRLTALTRKEARQLLRDPINLIVGLLLPLALILLFGYGLTFDVRHAPVAVVMEDTSPAVRDVAAGLEGTSYVDPVSARSMQAATAMLERHKVDGIVRFPPDFSRRLAAGDARVQLIVNGADSTTAWSIDTYVRASIQSWALHRTDRNAGAVGAGGVGSGVQIVQRMWFNEAAVSTWYLVPGLLVLIMTLIGAFLTSLLIAREWERGTLESLFVTPVRPAELVLSKLAPYMVVGAIDIVMCLVAARLLFGVPIRGSLIAILVASLLYLLVSLLLGLLISGVTRNQFAASQVALIASFLPALMLSGFVFDLRNVPLIVQVVGQILPATHFMELVKSLFLAGNIWPLIVKDCAILAGYAVVLFMATRRTLRKRLV